MNAQPYLRRVRSPSTWSPELLGPGKGTKCRPSLACAFEEYPSARTWAACNPGPASDSSPQQPRAWAVWARKAHTPWVGTGPVWLRHCEHMPMLFVCSVSPSPQHDWTSEPKKKKSVHHHPPCVRAEIRHWRDQQTEEDKTLGTASEMTGAID